LLGEHAVNALEKNLVIAREVRELLVGRPFTGNNIYVQIIGRDIFEDCGQEILQLGFTALKAG